jgi:hypothetical protein
MKKAVGCFGFCTLLCTVVSQPTSSPTLSCGLTAVDLTTNKNLAIDATSGFTNLAALTNGVTNASLWKSLPYLDSATCSNPSFVTIDLGSLKVITSITVWHYYLDTRRYCGQTLEISSTGVFGGEQTYIMYTGTSYGPSEYSDGNTYSVSNVLGRYVKHKVGSNTFNPGVHILEMKVMGYPCSSLVDLPTPSSTACGDTPVDLTTNKNLLVTGSPELSYLRTLIDGITDSSLYSTQTNPFSTATCASPYFVTIDLGEVRIISSVTVWHYYTDGRAYCGQTIELSLTGEFNSEQTFLYDTGTGYGPAETSSGNTVAANKVPARYVRHKVGRNTVNPWTQIVEMKVMGYPCSTYIAYVTGLPSPQPTQLTTSIPTIFGFGVLLRDGDKLNSGKAILVDYLQDAKRGDMHSSLFPSNLLLF